MLPDRKPAPERSASVDASALARRLGGLRKPTKTISQGPLMSPGSRLGGNATPDTGTVRASHEAIVRYKPPHRRKCLIISLLSPS